MTDFLDGLTNITRESAAWSSTSNIIGNLRDSTPTGRHILGLDSMPDEVSGVDPPHHLGELRLWAYDGKYYTRGYVKIPAENLSKEDFLVECMIKENVWDVERWGYTLACEKEKHRYERAYRRVTDAAQRLGLAIRRAVRVIKTGSLLGYIRTPYDQQVERGATQASYASRDIARSAVHDEVDLLASVSPFQKS